MWSVGSFFSFVVSLVFGCMYVTPSEPIRHFFMFFNNFWKKFLYQLICTEAKSFFFHFIYPRLLLYMCAFKCTCNLQCFDNFVCTFCGPIGLMSREFATQRYKVRIKGKVDQSWQWSSAPPLHFGFKAIEKGVLGSASTTIDNFTYLIFINVFYIFNTVYFFYHDFLLLYISKLTDHSRGQTEWFFFNSYYNRLIGLVGRVFAHGPGEQGSIPGRVIPKTLKMVHDAFLLNAQQHKVRIKGKVEQSRGKSCALPYTSV